MFQNQKLKNMNFNFNSFGPISNLIDIFSPKIDWSKQFEMDDFLGINQKINVKLLTKFNFGNLGH